MLTAKQEKFVQGLVSGLSQRQAYIEAGYSTEGKTDEYIDIRASELMKNSKVLVRYQELLDEHKAKALFTRQDAVNESKWLLQQSKYSIEEVDGGYVRQGTSSAFLGALDRLIALELLNPIQQAQYNKIMKDLEGNQEQDDKIADFITMIKGSVVDGTP